MPLLPQRILCFPIARHQLVRLAPEGLCPDCLENRVGGLAGPAESSQVQFRSALQWLRDNDPSASATLSPAILAWWKRPHFQPTKAHWFLTLILVLPGSFALMKKLQRSFGIAADDKAAEWHFIWAVCVGVCYLALVARTGVLAGLHLLWRECLVPALARWDTRCCSHLPIIGKPLLVFDLWLSRDVVPVAALLGFGWHWLTALLMRGVWRLLSGSLTEGATHLPASWVRSSLATGRRALQIRLAPAVGSTTRATPVRPASLPSKRY
jgi:hypothetical protein